ncbi:hypothetical protein Celaphus_00009510 [Cervus elaphus hippelaphus]|uniref:Uncharacterized protein n=1 Tax=Cervus elaphus hippelaphus TaxID=46360 RepID=A0A212C0W5_CEREH|nr:hypothetical protein Celaphus_00009510 [Cervus elaphus hippelaphus]
MRGAAPGKKPGAMQQGNTEVKTKKSKRRTPLELAMPPPKRRSPGDPTIEKVDTVMSRIAVKVPVPDNSKHVAIENKQAPYVLYYSAWTGFQKAESSSMWIPICRSRENFKEPVSRGMQRARRMQGVAPGKKPGAMQQRNVEVNTKKNKLRTPLEVEMVDALMSHLSLLPRDGLGKIQLLKKWTQSWTGLPSKSLPPTTQTVARWSRVDPTIENEDTVMSRIEHRSRTRSLNSRRVRQCRACGPPSLGNEISNCHTSYITVLGWIPESRVLKHVHTNQQSKKNYKEPFSSGIPRGRCKRGVAPGKKAGAMQHRNTEVNTKKYKPRTPLEVELVAAPRRSREVTTVENEETLMSRIAVKVTISEQHKRWLASKQEPKPQYQEGETVSCLLSSYFRKRKCSDWIPESRVLKQVDASLQSKNFKQPVSRGRQRGRRM